MGIPGLWNELKPYGHRTDVTADISERVKSLTKLQGKILAVDLSFWLCENVGNYNHPVHGRLSAVVAKPHLRNVFYRTIKLVSRVGALPVFVVDGDAPSLKMQVRLQRYHAVHNTQVPDTVRNSQNRTVRRNHEWEYTVRETVELLRLMGLPVLYARAEAEALCAQLNAAGRVDACLTPDSDAFLYGARTLIKELAVDLSKPVVDRYEASEIADKVGLEREHLVALALLLGCDFDPKGVEGCGPKQGVRLVRGYAGHEVLDRLRAWGRGERPTDAEVFGNDDVTGSQSQSATSAVRKPVHCGTCGHPGKVFEHRKGGCERCGTDGGECGKKGRGFQCPCDWCVQDRVGKARRKEESWWTKICDMIARQPDFPNEDIIDIFMRDEPQSLSHLKGGQGSVDELLVWDPPNLDGLATFLTSKCEESEAHWQMKALPLATAHHMSQLMKLRLHRGLTADLGCVQRTAEMAAALPGDSSTAHLLDASFQPSRVERIKVDATEPLYRLQWQRAADTSAGSGGGATQRASEHGGPVSGQVDDGDTEEQQEEGGEQGLDEDDGPPKKVILEWRKADGFVTDERQAMVQMAFPHVAGTFEEERAAVLRAKAQKEAEKAARKKEREAKAALKQTNIKSFFETKKGAAKPKPTGTGGAKATGKGSGDRPPSAKLRTNLFPENKGGLTQWSFDEGAEGKVGLGQSSRRALKGGDATFSDQAAEPSDVGEQGHAFGVNSEAFEPTRSDHQQRQRLFEKGQKPGKGAGKPEVSADKPAVPGPERVLRDPASDNLSCVEESASPRRRDADASGYASGGHESMPKSPFTLGSDHGADASPDAAAEASDRRSSLSDSPFAQHPERRAGFEMLAQFQRRLAALNSPPEKRASADRPVRSTKSSVFRSLTLAPGQRTLPSAEGTALLTSADDVSRRKAGLGRKRTGGLDGNEKGQGDVRSLLTGTQKEVGPTETNGWGTKAAPVEIEDTPVRVSHIRSVKPAGEDSEDSRQVTPVRKHPGEDSPVEGSPVTPSKRRAEECPAVHSPSKRLAEEFNTARESGSGDAAPGLDALGRNTVMASNICVDGAARMSTLGIGDRQGSEEVEATAVRGLKERGKQRRGPAGKETQERVEVASDAKVARKRADVACERHVETIDLVSDDEDEVVSGGGVKVDAKAELGKQRLAQPASVGRKVRREVLEIRKRTPL